MTLSPSSSRTQIPPALKFGLGAAVAYRLEQMDFLYFDLL